MATATTDHAETATSPVTGGAGVCVTIDADHIGMLTFDQPDSAVNVMNLHFIEELETAIDGLPPDLRGVILASGKHQNFVAGADLNEVVAAQEPAQAADVVRRLHRVLNRLASVPYPTVASINGAALGGGFELALACDYRVCVESDRNILGLPEVSLGLLPAGGGTQRLPRLIGLSRALALILEGERYSPRRGKRYGTIDDVVHPAILLDAARDWLAKGKRAALPRWSRLDRAAERRPLIRSIIYRQAGAAVRKRTRGHYPAPLKALDAVRAGQEQGFGAGLAAEAVAFAELATGPVAHNLISLFFATEGLKREQKDLKPAPPEVKQVGIVGAGFMGAGIAQAAAVAGCTVRLRDVAPEQVARGIKTARDLTLGAARKGRFSRPEAHAIVGRLSGTTDSSGFRRADLVIEAVFEDVEVKRRVIAELEEVLTDHAVIASNTSSLPVARLAEGARHAERVVGMHFFSPVHKMPLVEVVRGTRTSEAAVATVVELGRRMGKTVIVVGDGPGFYTTRVLGFMVQSAGQLLEQGGSIDDIDRAMRAFGFPVGPFALSDEVGLDVAAHISAVLHQAFPERFAAAVLIDRMVEAGRLGRKSGRGFYDYSGRKKRPDPAVDALRGSAVQIYGADYIQRRLVLALVNEAARCLDEGIVAGPRDGDVGAVLGIGFPPFLGGPFRYADSLGVTAVCDELRRFERACGPMFAPAPSLSRMAGQGARFYDSTGTQELP